MVSFVRISIRLRKRERNTARPGISDRLENCLRVSSYHNFNRTVLISAVVNIYWPVFIERKNGGR